MSRPERMSKNGRQIRSASPSATGRLAMSSGSRRLGGIAPALAAHLDVESRSIDEFGRASHGHTTAIHWAPSGPPAPSECVAQPGARRVKPQEARQFFLKLGHRQDGAFNLLAHSTAAAAGAKSSSARSWVVRHTVKSTRLEAS